MPPPLLPAPLRDLVVSFDRSPEHIVITDHEGVILYANPGAEKHTGYPVREMIGKKPGQLWGGRMPTEFYRDMWATIRDQKQAFVGDMRNVRKDGRAYWQEVHIIPVIGADEQPKYYIGIELTMNETSRSEEILSHAATAADREALRVRWPLAWLFEAGNLSSAQLEDLQKQYAQHGALDALVADLLAISNVLHASREADTVFAVDALVEEVIEEVRSRYPNRHYSFERLGGGSGRLRENRRFLREALYRLVANAAQYTPPQSGDIVVLLLRTSHHCVVRCQDNGIGISFKEQRRIFDKFFRGVRARPLHPAGSGLGLYLVKTIADLRGWDISCVSEPDQGACFELSIPAVDRRTPSEQQPAGDRPSTGQGPDLHRSRAGDTAGAAPDAG